MLPRFVVNRLTARHRANSCQQPGVELDNAFDVFNASTMYRLGKETEQGGANDGL